MWLNIKGRARGHRTWLKGMFWGALWTWAGMGPSQSVGESLRCVWGDASGFGDVVMWWGVAATGKQTLDLKSRPTTDSEIKRGDEGWFRYLLVDDDREVFDGGGPVLVHGCVGLGVLHIQHPQTADGARRSAHYAGLDGQAAGVVSWQEGRSKYIVLNRMWSSRIQLIQICDVISYICIQSNYLPFSLSPDSEGFVGFEKIHSHCQSTTNLSKRQNNHSKKITKKNTENTV